MIDSLLTDIIIDRKFMKDMKDMWSESFCGKIPFFMYDDYRYDIQGAIYQEIYFQNTNKKLSFGLAVITKEKQPDHEIIIIDQSILDKALEEVIELAPQFKAIKDEFSAPEKCGKM